MTTLLGTFQILISIHTYKKSALIKKKIYYKVIVFGTIFNENIFKYTEPPSLHMQ